MESRRLAWLRVQLRDARPELSETRVRRMALAWYLRAVRNAAQGRAAVNRGRRGRTHGRTV